MTTLDPAEREQLIKAFKVAIDLWNDPSRRTKFELFQTRNGDIVAHCAYGAMAVAAHKVRQHNNNNSRVPAAGRMADMMGKTVAWIMNENDYGDQELIFTLMKSTLTRLEEEEKNVGHA